MKNESINTKQLAALLKQIPKDSSNQVLDEHDPVAQLVIGFLEWNASNDQAKAAWSAIKAGVVDLNDLRVSHAHEILALIGQDYPLAQERIARLHEVLQKVFDVEHGMSLKGILTQGDKPLREFLSSLPGMPSFVVSYTMLVVCEEHCVPVDDVLRERLVEAQVVEANASHEQIAAGIESQIKHGKAMETYLALRQWAGVPQASPSSGKEKKATATKSKPATKATKSAKK